MQTMDHLPLIPFPTHPIPLASSSSSFVSSILAITLKRLYFDSSNLSNIHVLSPEGVTIKPTVLCFFLGSLLSTIVLFHNPLPKVMQTMYHLPLIPFPTHPIPLASSSSSFVSLLLVRDES